MIHLLSRLRGREHNAAPVDDRDLIALVNEARNDAQRARAIRAARARRTAVSSR